MSLPTPFKEFIPRAYWDDPLSDVLAAKADEHVGEWRDDVLALAQLIDPARIPATLLDELGYTLNAGLFQADNERAKREKIRSAIQGHKKRGSWADDAKPKVDAIAGGDAQLYGNVGDAWWVLSVGLEGTGSPYWSAFGYDSESGFDGIILVGAGDEAVFPGNIRIDVDNSGLTADQVEQIKLELADVAPAYYRVILGYVVAGQFIEYANGRIE